ncbi:MAG: hypothetical protein H7247_06445 [Polaromonas sp.]|nr:hypothetical protein [Gemmatimonadaceae bacterium]
MRSTPLASAPAATTTIVAEALLCSDALEEPRYSRPALRGERASTQVAENLGCISVTAEGLAEMSAAADTPALESLCLWSIPIRDLSVLAPLQQLRALDLRQVLALRTLDGIESLPLERLVLCYINRLQSIAALRSLHGLQRLDIDGASKATGGEAIRELTALQVLELDNAPALPSFDGFESLTSLESIRVFNTPIGNGSCSVAPLAGLPKLWQLYLCGRPKSLANLTDLERLGDITRLRALALDRVGDVPTLEWTRALQKLEHFALTGANLVDRDLSPLFELPALLHLSLGLRGLREGTPLGKTAEKLLDIVYARELADRATRLTSQQ